MARATRTENEPHDRLTILCDAMTDVLLKHPQASGGEKCAIFLDDGHKGGLVLHGWEDDVDALAHLFAHLAAIFEANGKKLLILPLGEG